MGDTSYSKGGGATLPDTPANVLLDAGNAGKLVSLAAGTGAGEGVTYIDAFAAGAIATIGAEAAGTALIADGLGDVDVTSADVSAFLASANAAAALASIGGGAGPVVLYASDCTAEAGSESASVTGTGSSSTFTLTASSTARVYGTSGATAARIVCPIPAGARRVSATIGPLTSLSGLFGTSRFLAVALRNAADGAAPTSLWGASINDVPSGVTQIFVGGLMGGANSGASGFNANVSPVALATNGWLRVSFDSTWPLLGVARASGASPTDWLPVTSAGVPAPFGAYTIPHTPDVETAVVVYLQSFGGGGATSITAGLRVTVSM